MDISMKGYLMKEKKTGTTRLSVRYGSKRRWFQLEGRELRYYDSSEIANERKHESLRGFINVFDIQSVRKVSTSRPNTLQIVTRRKGSLSLTADSEKVRNEWIEALQLAMRLKRSTVSISEVLKGSVSDDVSANSSDEEFWDKDLSKMVQEEQQQLYSTPIDISGNDDVFGDSEKKLYDKKYSTEKCHIYETVDLANMQSTTSLIGCCPADDDKSISDNAPTSAVEFSTTETSSVETYEFRESGYETTEPSEAADCIDGGPNLAIETDKSDEVELFEEAVEKINDDEDEVEHNDKHAVDVLRDLLRHTVVSETLEDFDIIKQDEGSEDAETIEEQEISAMDQLRALLGN